MRSITDYSCINLRSIYITNYYLKKEKRKKRKGLFKFFAFRHLNLSSRAHPSHSSHKPARKLQSNTNKLVMVLRTDFNYDGFMSHFNIYRELIHFLS